MRGKCGLVLALLASAVVPSQADLGEKEDPSEAAVSCALSPDALSERMPLIFRLFEKQEEVRELEDGYAFRFPGDDESASSLIDFVRFERKCCSFFVLDLTFEAHQGPIWLGVRGSPEVKSFVASWLESAKEG